MNQISFFEYLTDTTWYNRDGSIRDCPKWAREDRCGCCSKWQLLPLDEQPPEGWGVHGLCGSHFSKNKHKTSQSDGCNEFENRYSER